jgi:hypothetical protein
MVVSRLNEGLSNRVRVLVRPSRERSPLLETTGTRAAIELLDARLLAVEDELRELRLKVEMLDADTGESTV